MSWVLDQQLAEFFSQSKWYEWVGFEDVPLDYQNSA
jgi:hypothetical protein